MSRVCPLSRESAPSVEADAVTNSSGGIILAIAALLLGGCVATSTAPVAPPSQSSARAVERTATPGRPRDAFVLLSGGGTPLSNNYSQYLQARAIATYFGQRYPAETTWIFFGVGNREGEKPKLADARREVKRDDLLVESWVPGTLPRNRPATRESFLKALREEILPTVRDGGTLYLFVGDHGEQTRGDHPESLVTMWELKQNRPGGSGWSTDEQETLGVAELRRVLAEGLGRGRVVFCMTQCHSGGFHFLGVPHDVAAPASWYLVPPPNPPKADAALLVQAAGFTATDAASLAAGCDPDPDPEKWAGYERFVPESLLGLDLFTLAPKGPGLGSFAAAHVAATLVDRTIDKPRSSSEQFLERWATAIEKAAANPQKLTPRAAAALRAYARAVDTGQVTAVEGALRERAAEFARFTTQLGAESVAVGALVTADRKKIEDAIRPAANRPGAPGGRGRRGAAEELRKAWREVVRPAWKTAVQAGEVPTLPQEAVAFEKRLLELEDGGRDFLLSSASNGLLNETYWESSYAFPDRLDRAKAEAVTRWAVVRRREIAEWAKAATDEKVRAFGALLAPVQRIPVTSTTASRENGGNVSTRPLGRRTAAERILFYRRTLAAWECLIAMDERDALRQLAALIELERTPLPAPTK